MSLYNGIDVTAIATLGVYTETYGSSHPKNIANLYASFGYSERFGEYVAPAFDWIKHTIDWFWEYF